MKKLLAVALLFGAAFAGPPIYGPLQTQNNLGELVNNGTTATALTNLGGNGGTLSNTVNSASAFAGGNNSSIATRFAITCDPVTEFGADPYGNSDSYQAINTCLITYGNASLRPGTYLVSHSISIPTFGWLHGAGWGLTTIKLMAAANTDVIQSANAETWYDPAGGNANGTNNWTLSDLTVDGNVTNQTVTGSGRNSANGVAVYGYGWRINKVYIQNVVGNCLKIGSASPSYPIPPSGQSVRAGITTLQCHNAQRNGILSSGAHDSVLNDINIVDASQEADATYYYMQLTNNAFGYRVTKYNPWFDNRSNGNVAVGTADVGYTSYTQSLFNSGSSPLYFGGPNDNVTDSTLGPVNASSTPSGNAILTLSNNSAVVTGNQFICNSQNIYAVQIGASGSSAASNLLNANIFGGCSTNTPFNFVNDGGNNQIRGLGFATSGGATTFGGTPASTDIFDYHQTGTTINASTYISTLDGRMASLNANTAIVHDGVTDDTAAVQTSLNGFASTGGGTVLVGANQYLINQPLVSAAQPSLVSFNTSGFTLTVSGAQSYYVKGQVYKFSGFTSPLTQINGDFVASTVNSGTVVFLTTLTGSQTATATGIGSVYNDLTIPANVKLQCPYGLTDQPASNGAYGSIPGTFIVGSNVSVALASNADVVGCNFVAQPLAAFNTTTPTWPNGDTGLRANLDAVAAFSGTGVVALSRGSEMNDVSLFGFATAISANSAPRLRLTDVNVDASNCVYTNNAADVPNYTRVICQSFMTLNNVQHASFAITGIADNGSGAWRVSYTTGATNPIVGDTVFLKGATGAGSAMGTHTVSAIGTGTFDLSATSSSGTSGNVTTVANSPCVLITGGINPSYVGVGDTITGSGIPSSTTVTLVLPTQSTICMSANATAAATGVSVTTTPVAYSTGGTATLDANRRYGLGFAWYNGDKSDCTDCFVINHTVGYYAYNQQWLTLTGAGQDGYNVAGANDTIGVSLDGSTSGTSVVGGSTNSAWTAVSLTTSNTNQANEFVGMTLNAQTGGNTIIDASGAAGFHDSGAGQNTNIYVSGSASYLGWNGMANSTQWYFQNATANGLPDVIGNTYANNTQFQGNLTLNGNVSVGAGTGGTTKCSIVACSTTIGGAWLTSAYGSAVYSGAQISGTAAIWEETGSGTLSSFTEYPPAPTKSKRLDILFDRAVTTLTWNNSYTYNANIPPSVVAGQRVTCIATGSSSWNCQ